MVNSKSHPNSYSMKKYFSVLASILLVNPYLFAQNVGIGDPLPSAKLTISGNETTPNGTAACLKIINTASTNAWYIRAGATGNGTPANGFSIGDNTFYHFNMLSNGNLGLGLIPQSARLHVNGSIKMEGANVFEFGAGIAGKELNAGKIGYNTFGSNALEIVGAGTNSSNRRVHFFAEGGTHFSGPVTVAENLNTYGQLQINGNPGDAGQVITSNGVSAPTWKNQAFSNNTRFAFTIPATAGSDPLTYNTIYNLNPADVTVSGSTITINKSGLYHFEGFLWLTATFSGSIPPSYLSESTWFNADGQSYDITNYAKFVLDGLSGLQFIYYKTVQFQNEIYISAPATIGLGRTIGYSAGGGSVHVGNTTRGKLSGYLISE